MIDLENMKSIYFEWSWNKTENPETFNVGGINKSSKFAKAQLHNRKIYDIVWSLFFKTIFRKWE